MPGHCQPQISALESDGHGCALVGRLQQQVDAAAVSNTTGAPHGGAAPLLTFRR